MGVWILDRLREEPVYHKVNRMNSRRTACGKTLRRSRHVYGFWLLRSHAERFARPCMSCYPKSGD